MSGGVDSSVAALLLKQQGYDVIGVTMNLWSCHEKSKAQRCCSVEDQMDARRVCESLGIPFYLMDLRDQFRHMVVDYFVREYQHGRTPNPCIKCNEVIKFDAFVYEAINLFGVDAIATGHYARRKVAVDNGVEHYKLLKGLDDDKDQTYFLFTLSQEQLSKTLFPIGELKKADVRALAKEHKLPVHEKKESQEICFVPDSDYSQFILNYYPEMALEAGNFVDKDGQIVGRHTGAHSYTIGQRRGLKIGFGRRKYVVGLNVPNNEVILGENDDLFKCGLVADGVHWVNPGDEHAFRNSGTSYSLRVKIRYNDDGTTAMVSSLGYGEVKVIFEEPRRAIAPGQAVVFYRGEELLGGGWIREAL